MEERYKKLILGIVFDAVGMLSFTIPFLGEFSDVVWAPVSGFLIARMYKGSLGKVAGIVSFVEEFFPFTDVIPPFTLTWIYHYMLKKKN